MTTETEIITDAFRKIGVVAADRAMNADQYATGKRDLRRMLLSWQNHGYNLWTIVSDYPVTLTTASSYTLPDRALRVHSVRYRNASGLDMPLLPMTRQRYYDLPDKTTAGHPNGYFYDRTVSTGVLYIWQPLASVTTETLRVTYERPIEQGDDLDVPPEWENAVVYNLGLLLGDTYMARRDVSDKAAYELGLALGGDREESLWFNEECD